MCRTNNMHMAIRNTYELLIGKHQEKRSFGNIVVDLDGGGGGGGDINTARKLNLWVAVG
jgi:hypothetical protein